jgi:hypothetical protein
LQIKYFRHQIFLYNLNAAASKLGNCFDIRGKKAEIFVRYLKFGHVVCFG